MKLIAHATDLTGHDESAFVHAAALAVAAGARLVTVYGNAANTPPSSLPDARQLAARWGRELIHERRCHDCCDDVADTVLDALRTLQPDLVVLGTHARHGLSALAHPSVEEAITRNVSTPVLVVPNGCRGFVDAATGSIDLSSIVIAGTDASDVSSAREAAGALATLASTNVRLSVVTNQSLEAEPSACLVVIASHGHEHVSDVLFGSRAEHVTRAATCPVLVVPMPRR